MNDGMSEAKPLKSLVALSKHFFQRGDVILLKSGSVFSGSLIINGKGTEEYPIRIGAYGTGNAPKIDGSGDKAVTLRASNIIMDGIEVTNPYGLYGIYITTLTYGESENITVKNCNIHDVDINERQFDFIGGGGIAAVAKRAQPTWFKNINITDNTIKNVNRCAVVITGAWGWKYGYGEFQYVMNDYKGDADGWWPTLNPTISGNSIDGARGDAVLIQCAKDALIERNTVYNSCSSTKDHAKQAMVAVWTISSLDSVIQYNEVGYTKRPSADGEAFDTDHSDVNCIIQYNYSHNNEGGFVLLCNKKTGLGQAKNATVRYNLSVNDGSKFAAMCFIGAVPGSQIYNNTFWLSGTKGVMGIWGAEGDPDTPRDVTFTNNIFMAPASKSWSYPIAAAVGNSFSGAVTNMVFNNNLWSNVQIPKETEGHIALNNNVAGNPKFSPSEDYENKAAMLAAFTPAKKIEGAVEIPDNGGKDILGNPVNGAFFGCIAH
jgi:hypothetical protein